MTNKIRSLGVLLILPLLTVSIATTFVDIPSANALTRNTFDDSHTTARFGNSAVCGDHIKLDNTLHYLFYFESLFKFHKT